MTEVDLNYDSLEKLNKWSEDYSKTNMLSTYVQRIAFQELKEDENTRTQCLKQFREWIVQNKDIENCITDDNFLLRFLRLKKYSIYMAQQLLLKYLNLRKNFSEMFYNLDYLEPSTYELISSGYMFASPFRDKHGRRVIITCGGKLSPNFTNVAMARAHMITYETLLDDPTNQILGFTHIVDCADAPGSSVISKWNLSDFITIFRWGQQSIPMRNKAVHIVNIPTIFMYVYNFIFSLASQKLQDRTKMYNNSKELHQNVDPSILPTELGGEMPTDEMVKLWLKELATKRDRLCSIRKINLLSDDGIVRSKNKNNVLDNNNVIGSFRKLEID